MNRSFAFRFSTLRSTHSFSSRSIKNGGREYTVQMTKIVEPLQVPLMKSGHGTTAFRLRGWRLILDKSVLSCDVNELVYQDNLESASFSVSRH